MDTQTRHTEFVSALEQLWEGAFVIFSDRAVPDNYVQITSDGLIEVTSRAHSNGPLPQLTPDQVNALAHFGFERQADPNHRGKVSLADRPAVARLCEQLFAILGSSPQFDLDVVVDG